jgi:hypothetical protein
LVLVMSPIFWKTFLGHRPITMYRQPTSKRNKKQWSHGYR